MLSDTHNNNAYDFIALCISIIFIYIFIMYMTLFKLFMRYFIFVYYIPFLNYTTFNHYYLFNIKLYYKYQYKTILKNFKHTFLNNK